ncbi:5-hydroxytryptamine receptor-like [Stylophora pistillata]|uniref:5-hydroxytryptamine receptor-like n=1 Tax=Stylophora pistillata TaxID=50429 RepID=UPI000C03E3D1|nr:5-hydroxytryptamine receptor-like [Stylophora pistillata]XP_022796824.1 5-hydroxytryptamine receptor-like [Stylophora pistillata]
MVLEMSWSSALQILFCVALMFVIITGNSFVVASYFSNVRLRTGTYTFLVSFAISDLLVGCVSLPLWIYIRLRRVQDGPLSTFFISFDILSALASIFHLTTVSLERWLAISRPFIHEALSTAHYTIALCGVWTTALAIAAIRPALDNSLSNTKNNPHRIYTPFLTFVGYVGPGILVSVVNISIFKVARTLISNLPTITNQEESNKIRKNVNKQRRIALTLTFMTALFLVSWLSFFTVSTISVFCRECFPFHELSGFLLFSKWLQYSNSAMNPLVYAFRDSELRKTFVRLLGRCGRGATIRQALRVAPMNMTLNEGSTRFRTCPTTMLNETQV